MRRYRLDETAVHDLAEFIAEALEASIPEVEKLIIGYLTEE
jgi:hypothetical protein